MVFHMIDPLYASWISSTAVVCYIGFIQCEGIMHKYETMTLLKELLFNFLHIAFFNSTNQMNENLNLRYAQYVTLTSSILTNLLS